MNKLAGISAVAVLTLAGCGASSDAVTYKGESEADKDGNIATVTYKKAGDDITDVKFDIKMGDQDGASKREASENGEYGMKEETGKAWVDHVEEVETYVNDNDKMPTLNEEGLDADGATGATIHLNQLDEAFNAATEEK